MASVSVIIPFYKKHLFLKKAVESILSQTYKDFEIIIIHDDPKDQNLEFINNIKSMDNRIIVLKNKENLGAGFSRNEGIKIAKGNYIAFLDADDVWYQNKLSVQIDFMKKNNFSLTYTNYETFGKKMKKIINPPKLDYSNFIRNTSIATSTMMVRRKEIKNIKFTNSKICEDYYFKCKLLKKVKSAYCLKKNLTKYRIRDKSLQSNNIRNFYWIWKINKDYNNLNFFENFISLFFISLNSIKKYGGKNIFD